MMTAMILFGLNLTPLYNAIAKVESDRGATSDNVYQIRSIYINDINRLYPQMKYSQRNMLDKDKSEMMMYLYWKVYGYNFSRITRLAPTYETLARIHNGGPDGWRKESTKAYWRRVKAALDKEAK